MIAFLAGKPGGERVQFLEYFRAFHPQFVNSSARAKEPEALFRILAGCVIRTWTFPSWRWLLLARRKM